MTDLPDDPTGDVTNPTEGAVEVDVVQLARIEGELADVARALERLDDGTYGTCEACAAVLADEHLAAAPAARFCAEHEPAAR